jgi:8-oxo-dGTP pyrophosphatase MutT (NUDIX family)
VSSEKPIHPASTILLLRDGAAGLEVFMVVRHQKIDSFSGALVFPGGKVDPEDAEGRDVCRGAEGLDDTAVAFRIAAIREAFEECGVLLARPAGVDRLVDAERLRGLEAAYRQALVADELGMPELCRREGLELATELLVPYAHWITPAAAPKRFDTHFYLAPAPSDQVALHDGEESTDSAWVSPAAALRQAREGTRTVVFPTQMNLRRLGQWQSMVEALAGAAAAPVVTVSPTMEKHPEGRVLTIPAEAGYGGSRFLARQDGDRVLGVEPAD